MKHFILAAFAVTAVLFSGVASAKSMDMTTVASSPHKSASNDLTSLAIVAVASVKEEKSELPFTLVSKFSAVTDQAVKAVSVKSVSMGVDAASHKRQV